ncbi:NAD(P)/FAD-dependent oxidoreductase [Candidatus Bipolaricaulota bacterium]|nr:NAD(P)/FAD-dependent oxidoreductase [Candidatus Bipolaricaulota bacterium]
MSRPRLVIVGAGIAGLSAGCYAAGNGFETLLLEQHIQPGGVCTAWSRHGYTFDGCIHHLAGCRPGTPIHRMWQSLGAFPRPILFPQDLTRIEAPDGRSLTVFTDLDRLNEHLLKIAPRDAIPIRRYIRSARVASAHDLLESVVTGKPGIARSAVAILRNLRWSATSMQIAARRFSDPFLRRAFPHIQYDWTDTPVALHINILGGCHARTYGFPAGGSKAFIQSIVDHYLSLGGAIEYGASVETILVSNGQVSGVRLTDGTEFRADAVLSTAPAHATLFHLLDPNLVPVELRHRYSKPTDVVRMGIHVSFGVRRDLSDEPHSIVFFLPEPTELAGRMVDRLSLELYGFDPGLAPAGSGVLKVVLDTSYGHWKNLSKDRAAYVDAKRVLVERLLELLEPRFPGLQGQLDVADVATPITTERYTGAGQPYGSDDDLRSGLDTMVSRLLARPMTLPTVDRLFLAGQTVGGAGLPGCAAMGRNAIRALCREEGQPFRDRVSDQS